MADEGTGQAGLHSSDPPMDRGSPQPLRACGSGETRTAWPSTRSLRGREESLVMNSRPCERGVRP